MLKLRDIGGILEFKSYVDDFGYKDQTTVSAVMVSLQNVGAFLSALSIFWVSEKFGRKKTVQAAMAVFCTGVILQVVPSHSLVCFYIGRFVAGLGLGAGTAVVPAYNAEMAPKEIRGKLGSGMQWLFALGVMLSYWIDYGVKIGMPVSSKQWQIPVGLQMVPAGVLGLGLFAFPESTRWLAKKGRFDEAFESLKWIRASDGKKTSLVLLGDTTNQFSIGPEVKAEFNEIRVGLEEELRATEGFSKRELLEPANRYRLGLAFFMFLGQQCTGMTALAYFGPQFFKLIVGDNTDQSLLITGLFGAEKFITVGIYILFFSEMWGRKPTLWISALLMACCFIIVVVVKETTPAPNSKTTPAGIGMVAMIFLTNSIYQFSWGPLPWPYTAEVSSLVYLMIDSVTDFYLDFPYTHSRRGNFRRSINAVAVQFPLLAGNALHDERMGQLCLHFLCCARHHHGCHCLVFRERDQGKESGRDGKHIQQ